MSQPAPITEALQNAAPGQVVPLFPPPVIVLRKRCIKCGEEKPEDAFGIVPVTTIQDKTFGGTRSTICHRCKQRQKMERAFKKFDQERVSYTLRKANEVKKIDAPHVAQQCEGIMKLFNGLEGYVKFWYGQIMEAAAQKPGSRLVLEHCREINKLIVNSTAHRNSAPDVQHMQPDEIEHEMRRIVLDLAKEHPDDMLDVLDGVVINADDDEDDLEAQLIEELKSMEAENASESEPVRPEEEA